MKPKDASVNLADLPPEIQRLVPVIDALWEGFAVAEPICTSGCEEDADPVHPMHSAHSLHYKRNWTEKRRGAIDLRTKFLSLPMQDTLYMSTHKILERYWPRQYDVVNHNGQDGVPRHLHIEWDPK